jgi:hypothetical protein
MGKDEEFSGSGPEGGAGDGAEARSGATSEDRKVGTFSTRHKVICGKNEKLCNDLKEAADIYSQIVYALDTMPGKKHRVVSQEALDIIGEQKNPQVCLKCETIRED